MLIKDNGISKRTLAKLKRIDNGITRDGRLIRSVDAVSRGDRITLLLPNESLTEPNPDLNVKTAYESDRFIIFDKPVNMPVHPSVKHRLDTLGNHFGYVCPGLTFRPVNRLDKDTSGLCAAAKDIICASALQKGIKKTYYAVVTGNVSGSGVIDAPIARERESIIKRVVREDGKKAVTHYKAIFTGKKYSLLEIELETGRTHQIRVHLSYIGHPVLGDDVYGKAFEGIEGQCLHAGKIGFVHPETGKYMEFESPLPDYFTGIIKKIKH